MSRFQAFTPTRVFDALAFCRTALAESWSPTTYMGAVRGIEAAIAFECVRSAWAHGTPQYRSADEGMNYVVCRLSELNGSACASKWNAPHLPSMLAVCRKWTRQPVGFEIEFGATSGERRHTSPWDGLAQVWATRVLRNEAHVFNDVFERELSALRIDGRLISVETAYRLSHLLLFASDFGRSSPNLPARVLIAVECRLEDWFSHFIELGDVDVSIELFISGAICRWAGGQRAATQIASRLERDGGISTTPDFRLHATLLFLIAAST